MQKININIGNKTLSVFDFRNNVTDFLRLQKTIFLQPKPNFIPNIDPVFLKNMGYRLPFVKIDSETYIFPLNVRNYTKTCAFEDYIDLCVADLDLLIFVETYFYEIAKAEYHKKPDFGTKIMRFPDGRIVEEPYKRQFVRRAVRSSKMNFIEFNLGKIIRNNDEKAVWAAYAELQREIFFKENDFELAQNDTEHIGFTKGQITSYGRTNMSDALLKKYGILVKLQNGDAIAASDLAKITALINAFYNVFGDLSAICSDYSLLISYSGDKKMYNKKNAIGVFSPVFKAIGVSAIENAMQTFAHEMAHFIDFYLGAQQKRIFLSDDYSSLAGKIAATFRQHLSIRQTSAYQNRTKECFARAIEQYFSIKMNMPIDNRIGNFCENKVFIKNIVPLIERLMEYNLK